MTKRRTPLQQQWSNFKAKPAPAPKKTRQQQREARVAERLYQQAKRDY